MSKKSNGSKWFSFGEIRGDVAANHSTIDKSDHSVTTTRSETTTVPIQKRKGLLATVAGVLITIVTLAYSYRAEIMAAVGFVKAHKAVPADPAE